MKYKFVLLFTIILFPNNYIASQVYTPKGSLVPDTQVNPEQLTSYDISYIMQYMASSYPNADIIDNPTTTYNCHAYAWYMSEGGTPPVWMGLTTNPTPIYWNDGSYFETTERGNGLKVSYDNYPYNGSDLDNHSAITTTEEGVFISKWGAYPLVKHAKDYTPYSYSSLHYFKKNTATISGPSYVCPSSIATVTISNPPTNYTLGHSANLTPISGSTGSFTTSFAGGNAWVSINVNGLEIARKNFIIGSQITGVNQIAYVETNRYYADPACSDQDNIWVLSWQGMDLLTEKPDTVYGNNYVDVVSTASPNNMTIYDLSLIQNNGYIPIKYISVIGVKLRLVGKKKPPIELLLYPNPATDILTVEIKTDDTDSNNATLARNTNTIKESYTIQLWNERQGMMRTIEITESIQQISLQGLPNGMYFVHVVKDGKMLQRKIIWKN